MMGVDYELRHSVRRGEVAKIKELIKGGADYSVPGTTIRGWTPLHIACWGSLKPQVCDRRSDHRLLGVGTSGRPRSCASAPPRARAPHP